MFRTPLEKQIAELRFVNGMKVAQVAALVKRDKSNVSRTCRTLIGCMKQLGIDTRSPAEVSSAVAAILRRCSMSIAA